ncbi:germination protein YpeB [Bacillus sp. FSL K6-3431]|uniref:germination protein YpeB n=1 Tax=Bacillus sp. FSL K6-3431 TaxID=2921500 RepID=UPI0030F6770C
MIRNILIVLLAIGVAGTAFWGYQEHQEKNAILINAENTYQRAFHNLTYQMDDLHDKIGSTLAMNSKKSLSPTLVDVWRITSEARAEVGQLPLTLIPFNKTEEFLANIGNFSYRTAVRDLDNNPLSKEEYATLNKLYSQSNDIRKELRNVQHLVLKNNLRWMDVEMALAAGKESADNTIMDGFKTVEKQVEGYGDENLQDPTLVSFKQKDENYDHLTGKAITKDDAVKRAKQYSGLSGIKDTVISENGKGAKYGFYSVNLDDGKGNSASFDITKKGGYPIWFINHREIGEQKISLNEAVVNAEKFLSDNEYENLELSESLQYNTIGLFTFTSVQDGIKIYPESIKIKVALDNGQVIGFAADDYLKSTKKREIKKPALSVTDAQGFINSNVKIMEDSQAIIVNELGEEVLCFEFIGTLNQDTYRIYINAENGMEEKVEKLQNAESVYEDVV